MKSLITPNQNLMARVMDMELQRQNVIAGNIANVNTPKYKPRVLEFESELQAALNLGSQGAVARTNPEHMPIAFDARTFGPDWYERFTPREIWGEDRVDMEKEMVKMAKNSLHYNALSQITKSSFDGVKTIIMEGSK